MSASEASACRKLLETYHLNVPDRQALPGGRARFSVLLSSAEAALAESSFLPPQARLGVPFDGVVIERRTSGYWIHERHEVAYQQYSPLDSRQAASLKDALRAYLQAAGGASVDGGPIDYSA